MIRLKNLLLLLCISTSAFAMHRAGREEAPYHPMSQTDHNLAYIITDIVDAKTPEQREADLRKTEEELRNDAQRMEALHNQYIAARERTIAKNLSTVSENLADAADRAIARSTPFFKKPLTIGVLLGATCISIALFALYRKKKTSKEQYAH